MTDCVLFLHGHQPFYNEEFIVKEIIRESYAPLLKQLLDLQKEGHSFKINLSLTGSILQWFERLNNKFLLNSIQELLKKDVLEIILSPFYHAPLVFTDDGFIKEQFYHHHKMLKDMFNYEPRGFFPPELVFSTHKNDLIQDLNIDYLLIEGSHEAFHTDDISGLWSLKTSKDIYILPRNRAISWHFSDSKYPNAQWLLETLSKKKTLVTIGSDIECFGHHRGQDSFKFLKYFIENAQDNDVKLVKGSEAIKKYKGLAKTYSTETVTTWARSINVFFPHSKIIEMWFARNDAVSMYHRVEYFYFKLENAIQKMMENEESKKLQKIYDQLLAIKLNEIDDIRWAIYRQLTDAALYHEDFSNEKTYHSMLEKCRWIKGRLWEVEDRLNGIMYQL